MRPARAEAQERAVARGDAAAAGAGGDAGGLAEETEHRGLHLGEGGVVAGDAQDGLPAEEEAALAGAVNLHREALKGRCKLLNTREHAPRPAVGQAGAVHFRGDVLRRASRLKHLAGASEVDVSDPSGAYVLKRSRVEHLRTPQSAA